MKAGVVLLLLLGCGSKTDDHPAPAKAPSLSLPSGPVPVTLPKVEAAQLRTLTRAIGFVTTDAKGALGWGQPARCA